MYIGSEAFIQEEKNTHLLLTLDVVAFLDRLHNHFDQKRRDLLKKRETVVVQTEPVFLQGPSTVPTVLARHDSEVTAPANKQMMFHAFHTGKSQFIADFNHEKATSWEMMMYWQQNLYDAVHLENGFYLIKNTVTELAIKPRNLDMEERNLTKEGKPMSASLVDFGIYMYHNAKDLLKQNKRPHIYLNGIHNHLEARLWNDVFIYTQNDLQIPQGSIQVTFINENVTNPSQISNIIYELADHCSKVYDKCSE